jgi:ABC-type transport system substrate-binding protein
MHNRRFCWFLFAVLTLGLLLPQIGFSAEKPLIIAFRRDAARLDPHSRNETTTTTIQKHFYEALVRFDMNLKPSPGLAEAGFPNGFEFNFDCPTDRYINDQSVTEAIAHQLTKVGLKPNVVAQPKAVFFPKLNRYESPLFLAGRGTLSWQGSFNGFFKKKEGSVGRNNRGRYYNPEMEKRIDAANMEMDDKKHKHPQINR